MKNLKIITLAGEEAGIFDFPERFRLPEFVNEQVIFDSVLAERNGARQGTHDVKSKAEVSGTGKKPFKQKHTGKARQGSRRNPQFVGGGRAFGPTPQRNYKIKINRKAHALAYYSAIVLALKKNKITVLKNDLLIDQKPSTNIIFKLLAKLELLDKKTLIIVNNEESNFLISARNLQNVIVKPVTSISVLDFLNNKHILIQEKGLLEVLKEVK